MSHMILSSSALPAVVSKSKEAEAIARAGIAWAKENNDYELFVNATRAYIMARRQTTALVLPHVRQGQNGREGNTDVTFLSDFGFTKMQWSRRVKELELTDEKIDAYFNDMIAKKWHPSPAGLMKFSEGRGSDFVPTFDNKWKARLQQDSAGALEATDTPQSVRDWLADAPQEVKR